MRKQPAFLLIWIFTIALFGCASTATPILPTLTPAPTNTPKPTSTPFVMPKGDFQMSWDSYSSEYNSLGGIITITKKGSDYMEKIMMSDGSSATYNLSILSEGIVIKLDGHFGNSYKIYPHDYIQIESNGWLGFYDEQGLIYRVSPR